MDGRGDKLDADLVAETLNGQRRAFDELVRRYQRPAVSTAYRTIGDLHDALEVVQDSFIKAFQALDSLERPDAFRPWLMRIVTNLALNFRRSQRRRPLALEDCILGADQEAGEAYAIGSGDGPIDHAKAAELESRIQAALMELPKRTRMALVLFSIENLPQKEVAEILEMSVDSVKWHVFTARRKLKEQLAEFL
jgi:RNA polymerase sigma-70 factor (ECF subfamily)